MRSRNQGLFCVTLGVHVQDAHLWDLMAPRGASHNEIHTSEMEGAAFAISSCLSHKDRGTQLKEIQAKDWKGPTQPQNLWQMPREECLQKPSSTTLQKHCWLWEGKLCC